MSIGFGKFHLVNLSDRLRGAVKKNWASMHVGSEVHVLSAINSLAVAGARLVRACVCCVRRARKLMAAFIDRCLHAPTNCPNSLGGPVSSV